MVSLNRRENIDCTALGQSSPKYATPTRVFSRMNLNSDHFWAVARDETETSRRFFRQS
jgi:hypothetical protein